MNLTRLFVARPTLVFVLIALVSLAGFIAARSLVVQELPNTTAPGVGVGVSYAGASTTELRDSIVRPIEDQLAGSPSLDHIDTTIQSGGANINVVFTLDSDPNANLTNVERALSAAQSRLPTDLKAPTVRVGNAGSPVVVSISATSQTIGIAALSQLVQTQVVPSLEQISGVATVNAKGLLTPAYEVRVDPDLLDSANLTLSDVVTTLSANNVRAPGGIA